MFATGLRVMQLLGLDRRPCMRSKAQTTLMNRGLIAPLIVSTTIVQEKCQSNILCNYSAALANLSSWPP